MKIRQRDQIIYGLLVSEFHIVNESDIIWGYNVLCFPLQPPLHLYVLPHDMDDNIHTRTCIIELLIQ